MKKIYSRISIVYFFLLFFTPAIIAQTSSGWLHNLEPQKVFIQNKGQFKVKPSSGFDPKVQYAFDGHEQNFYFTGSGVVMVLAEYKKPKEKESEEREMRERMKKGMTSAEHAKMEAEENRTIVTRDQLTAQWIGANTNVQIIAEDEISPTYSYCFNDKDGKLVNESAIPAFRKLTYKDLYPNIDVVYEMHKDRGIKYSVIVYPGGDISKVKLQYSKNAHLLSGGDIKTHTSMGNIIDHAPVTFYADDKAPIVSSYSVENNTISFKVADHDANKTIVIDPWTQTPIFSTQWHSVWECDKDAAGNVYIIGGVTPMQLLKYNSAGTLQWTYNTPYDTTNGDWLGTFAVDNVGNSYVTRGSQASIQKISTGGVLLQDNPNPGGLFGLMEFWSISFNCDQTQLVVGGTNGTGTSLGPFIFNIDMNSLAVLNSIQVTGSGSIFGFPPRIQEVRAITASGNGNYYFLTHDSIGYIHQGLATCLPPGSSYPFHVDNGLALGYKCEDFRQNNTGIAAIRSFGGYVFTHRGNQVQKRNFYTGAVIATATIPGGAFTNGGFGSGNYVSNSGLDIDSCGNVYCGSTNGVVKFDQNLNQLGTFSTVFSVYDVAVSPTGDLIAAGSTGNANSGARTGYVQTFAAGTCKVIAIVCCDAFICPHAAVCTNTPAFNFSSATAGGVWSGTGITNATNGTFNPATAGVGTFTIYYTLPCGRDSTQITVNNCSAVSLCNNGNGTLTVSGGTAPYTWQVWDSTGRVCQGGFVIGTICAGGTWVATYGWRTFSTGAALTVTYPVGTDTLRVIDNAGTTVTSFNIATLPPCNACNLVVTPGLKRNVSCLGGSNGSAHVTTTGGTAPLTYTWSPNVSTVDSAFNLGAGTYTVTVRDNGGCSGTASFSITQPASSVSAGIAVNLPAACGANTGKIKITVTGGTPAYSYVWSPNVSTIDSAINLAAGTYHITVSDQNSCSTVLTVVVGTSAGITVTPGTTRNVSCLGGSNGFAHVNVSGGTTPYTYTWAPNVSTLDSANNLAAGTYTVTVRDANNCSGTASFAITQPASSVSVGIAINQPATCGNNNGKIKLTVTGGTPAYTYTWSPNVSTVDSAVNLAAGLYHITVTDQGSCSTVLNITVASAPGVTVTPGATTNVSCFGGNNGIAHVAASGGTTPYTYTWSPNVSTIDSAINLAAGTYTVTVLDANNCSGSATFTITQPAAALAATSTTVPAACGNNTGRIILIVTGGTPAYTYVWSPNVSTVDSAINLAAGTYNITITDARGCTLVKTVSVAATAGITVTPGATTPVRCFGGSTGTAHVTVSGGTTPYSYTWSPNISTVDSAINLAAGTYTVTVLDANNCSGTASFTITQPAAALAVTNTATQPTCNSNNGKIVLHVTGGTPAYSYTWSPNVSTVDSALNLAAGTYNITITDSRGCTVTTSVTISLVPSVAVSAGTQTNVSCFGGNNGVAHVTASGGATPYTYSWSPNVSTVDSAINLTTGTYTVTVRDANNCSGTASFTITQPAAPLAATNVTVPATCGSSNGKVVLTVTGGTPAYTYAWSPNVSTVDSAINLGIGTYNITITDSKGCTLTTSASVASSSGFAISAGVQVNVNCFGGNTGAAHVIAVGGTTPYTYTWSPNVSTTDSAINLSAGTYSVTVHDATTCSGVITFNITQPASALTLSATTPQGACGVNNGSIHVTAAGGTPGYTYAWTGSASTLDSLVGLGTGTYTVTVTDSKGCTATLSRTITVSPAIAVSAGISTNVSCFAGSNGTAHVTVTGGTSPFSYTWSPNVSTVDSATGLAAGTYSVTVRDASGCSGTASFTITQPAAALNATAATTPTTCGNNNGRIVLTVTGGTPAYSYNWSPNVSTVDSAINLATGTYNVTVTDANGCTFTITATVNSIPSVVAVISTVRDVSCHGAADGLVRATGTIGPAPYAYIWSTGATTDSINVGPLVTTTYTVVVTDANSCTASTTATVNVPTALNVSVATTLANCNTSNGTAAATVTGGTGPMAYQWSGGNPTGSVDSALAAGSYTLTVTDAHLCSVTAAFSISNFNAPTVSVASTMNELCHGGSTGSIHLSVSGSSPAYSYTWSPNVSTTDSAVNITAGAYAITVTDANNCIAIANATVTEPTSIAVVMTAQNADCGASNGWAHAAVTGGTPPYIYGWSNFTNNDSATGLSGGVYRVVVTDANGCTKVDSIAVGTNGGPAAPTISGSPLTFCQGDSVVLTSSAATGNTWSTTATTQSITVYSSGTYTVTQTVGGCTSPAASVTVTVNPIPPTPTISASGPLALCPGTSVTLTSSAATGNVWSTTATTQSITVTSGGSYTVTVILAGCPSAPSAPVVVTNLSSPTPSIIPSASAVCPGDSVTLDATTTGATAYAWSTSATLPVIRAVEGTYEVTVTVNGCTGSNTIQIGALPVLGSLILNDSFLLCIGDTVTLDATTSNATSYHWTGNGVNATTPVITVLADSANPQGTYYVDVTNSCGSITDSVMVVFQACGCKMVMGNAFSPNGDGKNELYGPVFLCNEPKSLTMHIYNRWGQKVFDSDELGGKWDGRYRGDMQPEGVYTYFVQFVGMENHKEKTFKMIGTVALIR